MENFRDDDLLIVQAESDTALSLGAITGTLHLIDGADAGEEDRLKPSDINELELDFSKRQRLMGAASSRRGRLVLRAFGMKPADLLPESLL